MSDSFVTPWTSLPGSSIHEISLARISKCVTISFSRGCSWLNPRFQYCRQISHDWAMGETQIYLYPSMKPMPPFLHFSSVQSLSRIWLFETPWTAAPTLRVYPSSCPLSWWCPPTISVPVLTISSCLQYFPASGSFQMSQFSSGGQNIRVSASASVFPMNIQDWFPLWWTGWISLLSRNSQDLLQHYSLKASIFQPSASLIVQLSHLYMTTGKTIALTRWSFAGKVMSLLFNMLSRFVRAFLPGSKPLLISWLQSPSAMILEPPKI